MLACMTTWIVQRRWVTAQEMGTAMPWIHPPLYVTAASWQYHDQCVIFYSESGQTGKTVYAIAKDEVYSIALEEQPVLVSERSVDETDELISVSEMAVILGLSRQRVLQMIYEKKVMAFKVGRSWVAFRKHVEELKKK